MQSTTKTLDQTWDELVSRVLENMKTSSLIHDKSYRRGRDLFNNGKSMLLTQSRVRYEFFVDDAYEDFQVAIERDAEALSAACSCDTGDWCEHQVAGLMQLEEELRFLDSLAPEESKAYAREGMMRRVMEERQLKAAKAEYKLEFARNKYGEHILHNEKGTKYYLTFRDIEAERGYCTCADYRSNKLGACKHLMYAFHAWKEHKGLTYGTGQKFPFVDISLDPMADYAVTWFPEELPEGEVRDLVDRYFPQRHISRQDDLAKLLNFINSARDHKQIRIRPEVLDKVEAAFDQKMLQLIRETNKPDFSVVSAELYPYQKEGIEFAVFKDGAILADEMGLGKTLQGIAIALIKKNLFGFQKTFIICPASLKEQWKKEIEKFSNEKAIVIQGNPEEREAQYQLEEPFFFILNYELVLRDRLAINKVDPDFIILDEAQRIKNYKTITANSIKSLRRKHALVLTGTPIENRLVDLYSIVEFIKPGFLGPLWEFSYQHCYFSESSKNKINGYYNLRNLKERLQPILLRREKRDVLKQLPQVSQSDIPVEMSLPQRELHSSFARALQLILNKKFKTPFDYQRIMNLLTNMRMVCDSTYLIDEETHHCPKLTQLKYILLEEFDIHNTERKVIIFSEWTRMTHLIGRMLRENAIPYVELSGRVPVKKRGELVRTFHEDPNCKVFLSTEAGGVGLNLQAADTVINFELPWNPAKKNQRIGRIDRIGQRKDKLTVFNFITRDSIESRIATGLLLKQSLFDGVLQEGNTLDELDLSAKGRAQFLQELEAAMDELIAGPADADSEDAPQAVQGILDLIEEDLSTEDESLSQPLPEPHPLAQTENATPHTVAHTQTGEANGRAAEIEQVMNQGLGFLAGIFKMATGKDLGPEQQKIEVDRETGEVVMRFKLPGF